MAKFKFTLWGPHAYDRNGSGQIPGVGVELDLNADMTLKTVVENSVNYYNKGDGKRTPFSYKTATFEIVGKDRTKIYVKNAEKSNMSLGSVLLDYFAGERSKQDNFEISLYN